MLIHSPASIVYGAIHSALIPPLVLRLAVVLLASATRVQCGFISRSEAVAFLACATADSLALNSAVASLLLAITLHVAIQFNGLQPPTNSQ
jgi:hypothetical protein